MPRQSHADIHLVFHQVTVVTKYIGRYLGRPVIATSRIDEYDGENVTFHYNRHEDDQLVVETIPVMAYMQGLVKMTKKYLVP